MADTYTGYLDVKAIKVSIGRIYFKDQEGKTYLIWEAGKTYKPSIPSGEDIKLIFENVKNEGDAEVDVKFSYRTNGFWHNHTIRLAPGESKTITHEHSKDAAYLSIGEHTLEIHIYAWLVAQPWGQTELFGVATSYTVVGRPEGDITKVEVDGVELPEGGTVAWTKNLEATIKVYFKNVGSAAGKFTIKTVDEGGATLCSVETSEIPADGKEYSVECGSFTPTEAKKKTLTVTIEP